VIILQINHVGYTKALTPLFDVMQMPNAQLSSSVAIVSPAEINVADYNFKLLYGLRWYLEKYLSLPIDAYRDHADAVQETLKEWGEACFSLLFDKQTQDRIIASVSSQSENAECRLIISSNDPAVLSWPWEALYNSEIGFFAKHFHLERQVPKANEISKDYGELPNNAINILYIISRPQGATDIDFQTLARPLVSFIENCEYSVHLDLLRPPTFEKLCEVLEEKPNHYHLIHFDGHGTMPTQSDEARFGSLVFECVNDGEVGSKAVSAKKLGELMVKVNIPYVILNACNSATLDENSGEPFSAVATGLLNAGCRGAVAMNFNLWENGAKAFVSGFYGNFFESGNIAEAVLAGRQRMNQQNIQTTIAGIVEFNDWIVPALYHSVRDSYTLPTRTNADKGTSLNIPNEARELDSKNFIGRDSAILQLERAMQYNSQSAILIHGLAGEGKTTLAKGFLQWLDNTRGLKNGALWFNFEGIYNVSAVVDVLATNLLGEHIASQPMEIKFDSLVNVLKNIPFVMVWDNFESVSDKNSLRENLPKKDRQILKRFLTELHGCETKVLITSRLPEEWLGEHDCTRIHLGGLSGEELWQYCSAVAADLGVSLSEQTSEIKGLIERLSGNPLAIRIALLQLKNQSAQELLERLGLQFSNPHSNEIKRGVHDVIGIYNDGLDVSLAPVLRQLGLYDNFAVPAIIESTLDSSVADIDALSEQCFAALTYAGLCHPIEGNVYKLHPVLHGTLSALHPASEAEKRLFVSAMSEIIIIYTEREAHQQEGAFTMMGANFRHAMNLAHELGMTEEELAIIQGFAIYAENTRNFEQSEEFYRKQARYGEAYGNELAVAGAYHHLGSLSSKQQKFEEAVNWYNKSLPIFIKHSDERGIAHTYHQFGVVAYLTGNLDEAAKWHKKSLELDIKRGDEISIGQNYNQLGAIAYERRDYPDAKHWYTKSLEAELNNNDIFGASGTYQSLGGVYLMEGDIESARKNYENSLELKIKFEDYYGATGALHGLGRVAEMLGDYIAAEDYYKESISILLKHGDYYRLAVSYAQVGALAAVQGDYVSAKKWYQSALGLYEQINDPINEEVVRDNLKSIQILLDGEDELYGIGHLICSTINSGEQGGENS
jgi:tetratricopeptide (TPR) repeat protein